MTSASLMHEVGHPKSVLWDNPEGQGGLKGGRWVQDGGDMYTHGKFMLMYGKNHHNIVIILQLNNSLINKQMLLFYGFSSRIWGDVSKDKSLLYLYTWIDGWREKGKKQQQWPALTETLVCLHFTGIFCNLYSYPPSPI